MQIGFNPYISKSSNNSISFQAGELNKEFPKYLEKAKNNISHAQYLLQCGRTKSIIPDKTMLNAVNDALKKTDNQGVQYYLSRLSEIWTTII